MLENSISDEYFSDLDSTILGRLITVHGAVGSLGQSPVSAAEQTVAAPEKPVVGEPKEPQALIEKNDAKAAIETETIPIPSFLTSLTSDLMAELAHSFEVCVDFETTDSSPYVSQPCRPYSNQQVLGGGIKLKDYLKEYRCTAKRDPRARVLSIGTAEGAWAVDLDALTSEDQQRLIRAAFHEKAIVGHNLAFDLGWAIFYAPDIRPARILDTMLLQRAVYPQAEVVLRSRIDGRGIERGSKAEEIILAQIKAMDAKKKDDEGSGFGSLAVLCVLCGLDVPDKSYQHPANWVPAYLSQGHYDYCIGDATLPMQILRRLVAMARNSGSIDPVIASDDVDNLPIREVLQVIDRQLPAGPAYKTLESAIPRLIQMQHRGIRIDLDEAEKYKENKKQQAEKLFDETLAGIVPTELKDDFLGTGVTGAVRDFLTKKYGADKLPKTEKGEISLSKPALKYAGLSDDPLLKNYLEIKELMSGGKKVDDFTKFIYGDGRIHPGIAVNTVTLRTSSREPNLQGVPRDPAFRDLFKAPPGRKILAIDYSAIELRIAAALSHRAVQSLDKLLYQSTQKEQAASGLGWLVPKIKEYLQGGLPEEAPKQPAMDRDDMPEDPLEIDEKIAAWSRYYAYQIAVKYKELANRGWQPNTPQEPGHTGLYLLDAFARKIDPHLATGLYLLSARGEFDLCGKSPIDFLADLTHEEQEALKKKYKKARQQAKAVNFGLLYGQQAAGLHRYGVTSYGLDWTLEEAEAAWHQWHDLYPEIGLWQLITRIVNRYKGEYGIQKKHDLFMYNPRNDQIYTAKGKNVYRSSTLSGRPVIHFDIKKALNYQDQGSGAEIALSAIAALPDEIAEQLVLFVHDELIFECSAEGIDWVAAEVERVMNETANQFLGLWGVQSEAEPAVGDAWIH